MLTIKQNTIATNDNDKNVKDIIVTSNVKTKAVVNKGLCSNPLISSITCVSIMLSNLL